MEIFILVLSRNFRLGGGKSFLVKKVFIQPLKIQIIYIDKHYLHCPSPAPLRELRGGGGGGKPLFL